MSQVTLDLAALREEEAKDKEALMRVRAQIIGIKSTSTICEHACLGQPAQCPNYKLRQDGRYCKLKEGWTYCF